jgi:glycosylphosphatidylinositol transamidase
LLSSPFSFLRPFTENESLRWLCTASLNLIAPTAVLYTACASAGLGVSELLRLAALGWDVWGVYTPVVVWCVWWPAWLLGSIIVLGKPVQKKARE